MFLKTLSWLTLVAEILFLPCLAVADGMVMMDAKTTGASVGVRATQQRAVLWLRGESPTNPLSLQWEIHIQPVFDRERGNAAWVVPFPVRPEVHEGSQGFLDELNLVTSPVFLEYCEDTGCSCPGDHLGMSDAGNAGGGNGALSGASSGVTVWEQGTVGALDYVILSTDEGASLAAWLEAEAFEVPDALGPLLAGYETEGTFFFVSRLSADADPALPMTTVRFVLPDLDQTKGIYPLRLTGLGVGAGERLGLTLWLLVPDPGSSSNGSYLWVPESHLCSRGPQNHGHTTPTDLESSMDRMLTSPDVDFLVTFSQQVSANTLMDSQICTPYEYAYGYPEICAQTSDLGIELPASWCKELQEIKLNNTHVVRLEGRLSSADMAKDLTLKRVDFNSTDAQPLMYVSNVFSSSVGRCGGECPPCPSMDSTDSGCALSDYRVGAFSGTVILLLLLALGRFLRTDQ